MFFDRPRVRWWAVVGAAGVTLAALLLAYQYKLDVRIYADAPGLDPAGREPSVRVDAGARAHRRARPARALGPDRVRAAVHGERRPPRARGAALFVLTWTLAGQMSAASTSNTFSEELSDNIDRPFDWIDRATGGAPTLYLGRS